MSTHPGAHKAHVAHAPAPASAPAADPTAAPATATPPADAHEAPAAPEIARVRVRKDAPSEWYHAGKPMRAGDEAEVDKALAIRLYDAGVIDVV